MPCRTAGLQAVPATCIRLKRSQKQIAGCRMAAEKQGAWGHRGQAADRPQDMSEAGPRVQGRHVRVVFVKGVFNNGRCMEHVCIFAVDPSQESSSSTSSMTPCASAALDSRRIQPDVLGQQTLSNLSWSLITDFAAFSQQPLKPIHIQNGRARYVKRAKTGTPFASCLHGWPLNAFSIETVVGFSRGSG